MEKDEKFNRIIKRFLSKYDIDYKQKNWTLVNKNGMTMKVPSETQTVGQLRMNMFGRHGLNITGEDSLGAFTTKILGSESRVTAVEWYRNRIKFNTKEARKGMKLGRFKGEVRGGKVIVVYKDSGRKVPEKTLKDLLNDFNGATWVYDEWFKVQEEKAIAKYLNLDKCKIVGKGNELRIVNKGTGKERLFEKMNKDLASISKGKATLDAWYSRMSRPVVEELMNLDDYMVVASKNSIGIEVIGEDSVHTPESFVRQFNKLHNFQEIFDEWYKPLAEDISVEVIFKQLEHVKVVDSTDGWYIINTRTKEKYTFDSFFERVRRHFGNISDIYNTLNQWYDDGVIEASERMWR